MVSPGSVTSAAAPADLRTPTQVVLAFLEALAAKDVERAGALLDPDVIYTNVSLPSIRGARRVTRALHAFGRLRSSGFEVAVHRIAADGPVVLTERTDVLWLGRFRAQFWVCGTFEVHDGRITLWRDYFDWANITAANLRAVAGALVPRLAPRLPTAAPR